jgi:hypothetical protein
VVDFAWKTDLRLVGDIESESLLQRYWGQLKQNGMSVA